MEAAKQAVELTSDIQPWQIVVFVVLALLLVLAIVKKLAKTAIVLAVMVGAGALVLYGTSAGWWETL